MIEAELVQNGLPALSEIKVEFSLTAQVNVTKFTARRKVNKLLLDHVGNLLCSKEPKLIIGERLLWRVPIWLALPTTGPLGEVGTIELDVQSGEMLFTQLLLDEIADRANALACRSTPAPS